MPALLDREMLHRVMGNLVRNAAQAIRDARAAAAPRGGDGDGEPARRNLVRVTVSVDGAMYVIDVDDDGPGIDPEVRASLFDPYVTTKRDGTGLGLSIVKKVIVDHGGSIDALDSPLGGARFRIRLPRAGTPEARAATERGGAPVSESPPASALSPSSPRRAQPRA
jgi:signal transduction histidine kinase